MHAREMRLARRLVRTRKVRPEAVDEALAAARTHGGGLIQNLIELGHAGEDAVAEALLAEGALTRRGGLALAGLALAALAFLAGRAAVSALAPARTVRVVATDMAGSFTALGETRAAAERDVSSTVLGRIRAIAAAEGERVPRGAPLVELDRDAAERALAAARARLTRLKAERDHLAGPALAAAERALEARRAALAAAAPAGRALAEAEEREAEAVLERVRNEARVKTEEVRDAAAAAAIAEDDAAELTIRAPIDGTVVRLALRPGEVAAPGVPILRVAALDTIVAEVRVAETAVAALEANGAVELVLDAFPGRTFQGRLLRVSEAPADPARVNLLLEADGEKAFVATIAIDDPPVGLRPGLSVAARLSGRRAGAITVPREALFFEAGRRCIRVMEGGVPVTREVRVGLADGSRVEISGGLRAGDVVYLGR